MHAAIILFVVFVIFVAVVLGGMYLLGTTYNPVKDRRESLFD